MGQNLIKLRANLVSGSVFRVICEWVDPCNYKERPVGELRNWRWVITVYKEAFRNILFVPHMRWLPGGEKAIIRRHVYPLGHSTAPTFLRRHFWFDTWKRRTNPFIPTEKIAKAFAAAASALCQTSLSPEEAQSLTGYLPFCAKIVRLGRVFLRLLWTLGCPRKFVLPYPGGIPCFQSSTAWLSLTTNPELSSTGSFYTICCELILAWWYVHVSHLPSSPVHCIRSSGSEPSFMHCTHCLCVALIVHSCVAFIYRSCVAEYSG